MGEGGTAPPPARKLSHFRDPTARDRYLTAYHAALEHWPVAPTHVDVDTAWGTTHVLTVGPSTGTPLVLLHAVAVASPAWFANVAALSAHHRVHAIDTITDVGMSAQSATVRDRDELARWLDEVLARLGPDPVHLVGLSYGGWLALNQAISAPDRLASVTAVDPIGALGRPKVSFMVGMVPDALRAKLGRSDDALHRLLARLNGGRLPEPPLLDLSVAGLRTFVAVQPVPKRLPDAELRRIRTPALFMFGSESPVNDPEKATGRVTRCVPGAQVDVVPGAGHMLPVQMPERFATTLLGFVESVDQPGNRPAT
jgi:pimeloyl-ACP methyl ester carboxylesterase